MSAFSAKRTKFDFGWGSSLNPAGVALEIGTTANWQVSTDRPTVNETQIFWFGTQT